MFQLPGRGIGGREDPEVAVRRILEIDRIEPGEGQSRNHQAPTGALIDQEDQRAPFPAEDRYSAPILRPQAHQPIGGIPLNHGIWIRSRRGSQRPFALDPRWLGPAHITMPPSTVST